MSDTNRDGSIDVSDNVNDDYQTCTVCTGDTRNNMFFVGGQCRLDQLTYEQVIMILRRHPDAAAHLRRITSDPILLRLADETVTLAREEQEEQAAADRINRNNSLPFYTVFRGNTDGTVR